MIAPMRRLVLVISTVAALLAPGTAAALDRTVSVKATVEREVPNDAAEVRFAVSKERRGRDAALRIVAVRVRAVIAAAETIPGVGPGDVTTGSISVRRVERGEHPVYRASEGVTVVTHRPEAAGELVAAGVAAGATGARGPNFFVGNREAAYDAALVEALKRAKTKAEMLAAAVGATLGPAIAITEGGDVVSTVAPGQMRGASACEVAPIRKSGVRRRGTSASACAGPTPPVKPGTSSVTATVNATFALA